LAAGCQSEPAIDRVNQNPSAAAISFHHAWGLVAKDQKIVVVGYFEVAHYQDCRIATVNRFVSKKAPAS
jgi:hypothetical protein